ncbi:28811_t:CDS:2, partial [Dentiscutata erythropus]
MGLKEFMIENFDCLKYRNFQPIIIEGKTYALKCLNNKDFDYKTIKRIRNEIKTMHNLDHPNIIKLYGISKDRENVIPGTPSSYSDLYRRCWSSYPDQRPSLDQILSELVEIMTFTTVDIITNRISSDYYDYEKK